MNDDPLRVQLDAFGTHLIICRHHRLIASLMPDRPHAARRIVASWNACLGLDTDILERAAREPFTRVSVIFNAERLSC